MKTPTKEELREYVECVRTLAKITGVDSVIQRAHSGDPRDVYNSLVMSVTWLGSVTVGSVETTTAMLGQAEVLLATAPAETAAQIREQVNEQTRQGRQLDMAGKETPKA